jgi:Ran GTPase-activating protein (RanGAP) involved in mRNA processing and transport
MRLRVFDISHNPIGDGSIWLLLEFIRQDTDLTSFNVSYCDLTSAGIFPICNVVRQRMLDYLDISGNAIRSEGAEHVKELLLASPHIREIHFDNVQLGEGDVAMLVDAAGRCRFSEVVSMVANVPIGHRVLPPFIKVDMRAPPH